MTTPGSAHEHSGKRIARLAPFRSTKAAIKLHTLLDLRGAIPAISLMCDQRVMLNGNYPAKKYPEHLRRIRFRNPESSKSLVFLANNTARPALTSCPPKSRWQAELFFKWINQHLRIKPLLGTSETR